jgi:hypothetical protein
MKVVSRDFLNDNEYQSYPIDVRATFEPYSGTDVAAVNSLLVDMKLILPGSVAACAFIAGIKVTNSLVTLTIMGSKTHPFSPTTPPATLTNEQYSILGAFVLAVIQVRRTSTLPGSVVEIQSNVPGVGGWVILGSGVLNVGSWSFSGPASSMISDKCITRYEYGGVTSVGRLGFNTAVDGRVQMVGQNGIEVIPDSEGLAIEFSGTKGEVRQSLQTYLGECGGRPESGTCAFNAIKSINGLVPQGGDKELVVVLDKPLYATYEGTQNKKIVVVSSDLELSAFCKGRINIPETCSTAQGFTEFTTRAHSVPLTRVALNPNTQLTFEINLNGVVQSYKFTYVQQHPTREAIAVFTTNTPVIAFGERLVYLHIDEALSEWQLYEESGPSLVAFGAVANSLRSESDITHLGEQYHMTLGPTTIYDQLDVTQVIVGIQAPDEFEEAGIYIRKSYGRYEHSSKPGYRLEIRGAPNDVWAVDNNGLLLAAGSLDAEGRGVQTQTYIRANGETGIKSIAVLGAST